MASVDYAYMRAMAADSILAVHDGALEPLIVRG
jgi:hypothetical protein